MFVRFREMTEWSYETVWPWMSSRKLRQYNWFIYHMQCVAGGWIIIMSYKLCKWSESHWFRTRMAWRKKLLLILSVLALRQQQHLPDRSREKSLLLGWWRSLKILSALVLHLLVYLSPRPALLGVKDTDEDGMGSGDQFLLLTKVTTEISGRMKGLTRQQTWALLGLVKTIVQVETKPRG